MSAYRSAQIPPGMHPVIAQLVRARHDQGLSQEALAKRIGTTQTAVSHWEAGRREPRFANVARWSEALGYRLVNLIREETP